MSRILIIGDLHVKAFLLPFIEKTIKQKTPDQIILMGDYLDDWGVSSTVNVEATQKIFTWSRRQGNATLLFGNHDMAYYSGSGNCSGNDYTIRGKVRKLLEDNLDILRVAESSGGWLLSHAGLCSLWTQQSLHEPATPSKAAEQINELLKSPESLEQLETIGRRRGGWQKPGPLWADWSELAEDYYPGFNQIVGHSPKRTCKQIITKAGEQLWCCDTFSTNSKGKPYGDQSMLLLDTCSGTVSAVGVADRTGIGWSYQKYSSGIQHWEEYL